MKTLEDFEFQNKRVLLRCDFNVPLSEKREILDDFRIRKTLPTIEYLKQKQAKIILISHLGDSEKGKEKKYSLKPIASRLEELLNQKINFIPDCLGRNVEKKIEKMKAAEVILLENLRFYPEEKENEPNFVRKLAQLGDIFVQDGFGVCHRSHASVVGIPRILPAACGFLLAEEIAILSQVLENPDRPLIVIIGGVKISTKIELVRQFLERADHLLLGGKIANTLLKVKGLYIKETWEEEEEKLLKVLERINLTNPKLHLPVDGIIALSSLEERYLRQGAVGTLRKEEEIFDIGPETIETFKKIIESAKMIVWNGPLGYFEKPPFDKGTTEIAKAIVESDAFSIAGGGETIEFINKNGLTEKFNHISTGGGAMLDFLSGQLLPGIEVLEENYGN
ncbi:MAG: phosphoglycerate kinase [Candidatus Nealsonbacteria bacterium CG_4_9_14_3_um_filter_35_11]|uniref:Phosphoglycerate kinase n=1 Tax=Candidatus Nealsonbacteria bacterium CG02_land_8_20_14_3_00_34_20 TaxID=1974698 RepID=A0A2M7DAQ6_9BACT|nr:MAG: phosphoglycerate kinase [Candidatus Nealsonbacteria bacterium CG02_land_8_20_14_3_00_34_20]PIW92723.1 MAG: phosphoglycerate kinase [Candidatus Nealsonbacteria bacterium CG_4_8_14_3_um_filter_34_13]PIZ89725.1 MAG: phosphoglycerate kinase [Candidatus Nealsonbacteria bacterium CG_4_10_14_0_2_um_filter_35_20]PJA84551.1 MAG: phosphoglycerate kinase [Candidatus Nealsonbacteria bacterium CG_4_9_14_3_um_filter_35_11]